MDTTPLWNGTAVILRHALIPLNTTSAHIAAFDIIAYIAAFYIWRCPVTETIKNTSIER